MLFFQFVIRDLASRSQTLPDSEGVDIFMDRNKEYSGQAKELFKQIIGDPHTEGRDHLKGLSFQTSEDFPGLQAADLFAYETMKLLDRRFYDPARDVRKAIQALIKIPCHGGFIGKRGLNKMLTELGIANSDFTGAN